MNPPAADQSGYTGRALCCKKQTWYGTTACGKQIQAPRGHKRSASQKPPCSKEATASVHNGPTVHNLPVLRLLGQNKLNRPLYRSSCQQSTGSGPLSNAWLRSKMYQIDCHHCTLDWRRCASFRRSCARSGGKRQAAFASVIKRAYRLPARYKRIRNTAIPNIGTHLKKRKLKGTASGSRRI